MKRLLPALCVLALFAAACGDDSTGSDADSTTTTAASTATTVDPGTDDPPDDTAAPDSSVPDVPLFASYQGVSETAIEFGVAAIDAEALIPFGVDLGTAPVEEMYTAWSDAQNERGGVLGRDLVPHVRLFLPVGTADSDAVCAEFAEDLENAALRIT